MLPIAASGVHRQHARSPRPPRRRPPPPPAAQTALASHGASADAEGEAPQAQGRRPHQARCCSIARGQKGDPYAYGSAGPERVRLLRAGLLRVPTQAGFTRCPAYVGRPRPATCAASREERMKPRRPRSSSRTAAVSTTSASSSGGATATGTSCTRRTPAPASAPTTSGPPAGSAGRLRGRRLTRPGAGPTATRFPNQGRSRLGGGPASHLSPCLSAHPSTSPPAAALASSLLLAGLWRQGRQGQQSDEPTSTPTPTPKAILSPLTGLDVKARPSTR